MKNIALRNTHVTVQMYKTQNFFSFISQTPVQLHQVRSAMPRNKKAYCFRRDRFRQYTLSKLGIVRRRDRNETLRYI
jgi:hypothetical protein